MMITDTLEAVRNASYQLALIGPDTINQVLEAVADALLQHTDELLAANAEDLARMNPDDPKYDRLKLTAERLQGIADDTRRVAQLPSPLDIVLDDRILPNGLHLRKVSVPFGVIYEARPNVSFDVFSLCFKSGSACVLKGGSDADGSNRAIVGLIHEVLVRFGIDPHTVELLPASREATTELLEAVGYIDILIPRGGKQLIYGGGNEAYLWGRWEEAAFHVEG